MKVVLFYHSLISDWNHGNAHFLRGVASELVSRGHQVVVYEPRDAWSVQNLVHDHGETPLREIKMVYPDLVNVRYDHATLDLDQALDGAELVIVHEWNDHDLVQRIGRHHLHNRDYRLLFHDTHHRALSDSANMAVYDLSAYDGVLAFGNVVRELYLQQGWAARAWTWHEAADTRIFHPARSRDKNPTEQLADLVWVGNWGDDERTARLNEFLIEPVQQLELRAHAYGVRYPADALARLTAAGIVYKGWLPNYRVPTVFHHHRVTVHIPRRPYVQALPGIPTIRVFEALACGIPLICAPWEDCEKLFTPGQDYLVAHSGEEMRAQLRLLLNDADVAAALADHGRRTIEERHTCRHRVDELMNICCELGLNRQRTLAHDRPDTKASPVRTDQYIRSRLIA
ncbi:MAG: glycosyltransferase [Caldilineaceae bacterium]